MLRRLVNEAHFQLTLTTTGPMLVRSGHATLSGPDMTPVLTYRDGDWQVYIPGSSLKGVIRSHAEKVCRTLNQDSVCDPFHKVDDRRADAFCGDRFQHRKNADETIGSRVAYRDACPACRLFGSTEFIGRVSVNDAYLADWTGVNPTELRDGVGIDRLTGGAADKAKFDLEVVSSGTTFTTELHLRNFEIWQLGMLMVVVQDLEDELVRIGSGKSRGLGAIKGQVSELTIRSPLPLVRNKPANTLWGLGRLQSAADRAAYNTFADDALDLDHPPQISTRGIRECATYGDKSLSSLKAKTIAAFAARISDWQTPETMTLDYLQKLKVVQHG